MTATREEFLQLLNTVEVLPEMEPPTIHVEDPDSGESYAVTEKDIRLLQSWADNSFSSFDYPSWRNR